MNTIRFMIVLILAGTVGLCAGCSRVTWRMELDRSLSEAAEDGRLVLVYYWKPFNSDCGRMDRTVFHSKEIAAQMKGIIPVRLDATFHSKLGEQLGMRRIPSFVVIGPKGEVIRRRSGPMDEDQFMAFLVMAKLTR